MPVTPPKASIPGIAENSPVFDIVSDANDLIKFRGALRAWFMSYLTQTDEHLNHSSLAENIWFYEAIQEWLDNPTVEAGAKSKAL